MVWGRLARTLGAAGISYALLAGCSVDNYSKAALRADLVEAGLTPAQARCVADAMEEQFDAAVLASRAERPSTEDLAVERALLERCGVKL